MQHGSEEEDIFCSVFTQLKALGVKVPKAKKLKSNIPKQARPVSAISLPTSKIFGLYLNEQQKVSIADYLLPAFIVTCISYLKKFANKEGLFRLAGSVSRQRDLRVKLERGEGIEDPDPNDIASLLKQWLRELPEPLIPSYLQDLFVRCQNLQDEEGRINAVFLCCHLLPADHLYTLKYLLDFLSEIVNNREKNKMGAKNLAIVMAPNIFVMERDAIDKSSNNLVQQYTSVMELLINNVHRFEELPLYPNADLDSSVDILDCSPSKKKKNGPVHGKKGKNDLLTGIKKLVGQNSVASSPYGSSNLNECKPTNSRSAYKRKAADCPMTPSKKTTFQNETDLPSISKDPLNVGTIERTVRAHSRRKSFGFLKRKEKKRQKSGESSTPVSSPAKLPRTPYPFQEKIAPFKEPTENQESCFDKSSIISPIDIDKLLASSVFVKKSVSDCYLTKNEELKSRYSLSASFQGCVDSEESNHSAYYLRSNDGKRAKKHYSDSTTASIKALDVNEDSSNPMGCSPWFNRKSSKSSPRSKKSSPQQEVLQSPTDTYTLAATTTCVDLNENNGSLLSVDSDINSLSLPQVPVRRSSSRLKKKIDMENKKLPSVSEVEKTSSDKVRSDATDANDTSRVIAKKSDIPAESNLQKKEIVKRKCSLSRQEAFIVKPKSSRNTFSHVKRADSIKLSKSKSICISQSNGININGKDNENTASVQAPLKKSENAASANIPSKKGESTTVVKSTEKKGSKRNMRNGSIVRGRPNTVKTGLPSGAHSRYNNESTSVNSTRRHSSASSVATQDLSMIPLVRNINLLSPTEEKFAKQTYGKNCDFEAIVNVDAANAEVNVGMETKPTTEVYETITAVDSLRVRKTAYRRRMRGRLCSNSDSKIHGMRKISSKVSRINSFPESAQQRKPRNVKLRTVKSLGPQNSPKKEDTCSVEVGKENVCIQESLQDQSNLSTFKTPEVHAESPEVRISERKSPEQLNLNTTPEACTEPPDVWVSARKFQDQSNLSAFKTPDTHAEPSEIWVSGRTFLENEEATNEEDAFNKRESIALIIKNKPGHVLAKAHLFGNVCSSHSTSTPMSLRSRTPGGRYDPQYSNVQARQSQKRSASARSFKSPRKISHLPPPPKFIIADSPPDLNHPLKGLTIISNLEDKTFSSSPVKKPLCSPNKVSPKLVMPESSPTSSYPLKELTNISSLEKTFSPSPVKKPLSTPMKNSVEKSNKKCSLKPKRNSYSGHTPYKLPKVRSKVSRSESSPLLAKVSKRSLESLPQSPLTITNLDASYSSKNNCFNSPPFDARSSHGLKMLLPDVLDDSCCKM